MTTQGQRKVMLFGLTQRKVIFAQGSCSVSIYPGVCQVASDHTTVLTVRPLRSPQGCGAVSKAARLARRLSRELASEGRT